MRHAARRANQGRPVDTIIGSNLRPRHLWDSRVATHDTFLPESVRSAIAELWRASPRDELRASESAAFRLLVHNCRAVYGAIGGSRLEGTPSRKLQPTTLQSALLRFFRWCGAPWNDSNCLTVDDVALRLHRALLTPDVNRVYLVPLDQLRLEAPSDSLGALGNAPFGPNELRRLTRADLNQLVPVDGISRFGRQYAFPAELLDGLCWLVVTVREDAGALWKRTPLRWFHETTYGSIGETPLYEPSYPRPVEDALFVLLLTFRKLPNESPWRPFLVPWIYSFTDDPFAEPERPPEPSALTWRLVGDPPDEVALVPDQLWPFPITEQVLDELRTRQSEFEITSAPCGSYDANLSALVPYFYVRAFAENGIQEIIANLSCIEATLMRRGQRGRKGVLERFERLTDDQNAREWLKSGYRLRDRFLHSLAGSGDRVHSRELAQIRWSVTQAVREYMSFACKDRGRSREDLLGLLSQRGM